MKKTVVIGASENPERYSNKAIRSLLQHQHPIIAIGNKVGVVEGVAISKELITASDVDTVTLYINPTLQAAYTDYILSLKPKRVVFNPGTENPALEQLLKAHQIEPVAACTLVLLATGQY